MKLFHGWRISIAGASIQFLHSALLVQAFGAYVALLSEQKGWSKTALAAGAALQVVEGALLGPLLGWLVDRFGPRGMVQVGLVLLAGGFFCFSQVETLPGFYGAVLLIVVGTSFCGYFPFSVALVHWFQRWRARALSLMSLGLALGGIAAPLVAWAMQNFGWQRVAFASSMIFLAIGLPLSRVLRRNPAEIGETMDGLPPAAAAEPTIGGTVRAPERSFTAAEALRTRAFWLLGFGHAFALLVVTAVNVHAISHMKEGLGYTLPQAGFVITLMTLSQAGGVLLGAAVGDRWNKRHVAAGCMLAHMGGLLMLTWAVHPVMLGAFAVLHGVAWGLRGPFMQALRADYFGLQSIGMILGLSAVLISLGQVAGPLIAGAFADFSGHYRIGFTLLALVAGTGSLLFLMARKPA
ncbi:MFS transporter [Ramlibacter sp. USB13]|uniref:MFS transporter n=1 Tax=Ramlibacter cellulosilyticus TaxID=2764187 RepID=A0A923SDK4_9BURK|nr:MFS transporter [Ramlibacter cellulosilyticus]MBC5786131.1 MFS transporter [Ramlibacter cellulosilyticus]